MWKSAYVGVYQLLNWKMHGETLKFVSVLSENDPLSAVTCKTVTVWIRWYQNM